MKPLFIQYPKCSKFKRAVAFLKENNIQYDDRDIMIDNPSKEELKKWIDLSGLPIKRFFNSSGLVYRDMGLKDKLAYMSEDEMITLLAFRLNISTGNIVLLKGSLE